MKNKFKFSLMTLVISSLASGPDINMNQNTNNANNYTQTHETIFFKNALLNIPDENTKTNMEVELGEFYIGFAFNGNIVTKEIKLKTIRYIRNFPNIEHNKTYLVISAEYNKIDSEKKETISSNSFPYITGNTALEYYITGNTVLEYENMLKEFEKLKGITLMMPQFITEEDKKLYDKFLNQAEEEKAKQQKSTTSNNDDE